jgi:hypothetical protein
VLGGAKSSRLSQRLQHQDKLVDSIGSGLSTSQLGSNFVIVATVKQGQDPAKVEKIIDEELDRLIKQGPTAAELERAKTGARAGFIRRHRAHRWLWRQGRCAGRVRGVHRRPGLLPHLAGQHREGQCRRSELAWAQSGWTRAATPW